MNRQTSKQPTLSLLVISLLLSIIVIFHFSSSSSSVFTSAKQSNPIDVYIIPHSHTDPGWLKSVRGYQQEVFQILSNIISAIKNNKHRKFVWADTLYFKEWFEIQNFETQQIVHDLIGENRLEMVGGGWVQNDEACPSYTSIIDQMTIGHQYLLERFGIRIKHAWQIDPFGHDGRVAQLYAEMGLDSIVINRVHHRIKAQMKNEKALEFLWRFKSANNANSTEIFTHVLHTHYSAVFGFDFENSGVQRITKSNVESRSKVFVDEVRRRSAHYRTKRIMIPFGDDFKFKNADVQFTNMDQVIEYINENFKGEVTIRYGTVGEYFDAMLSDLRRDNVELPVVRQDFVPYADNEDSYWTGYYATLPNLKKRARDAESALNAAENALLFTRLSENVLPSAGETEWIDIFADIQTSRENVALIQHHDGITGTCRKEVYHDYMKRLANVLSKSNSIQKTMINALLCTENCGTGLKEVVEMTLEKNKEYGLIVHNSDSDRRVRIIRIRSHGPYATVKNAKGEIVPSQSVPVLTFVDGNYAHTGRYDIYFLAIIPGYAIQKYTVLSHETTEKKEHEQTENVVFLPTELSKSDYEKPVFVPQSIRVSDLTNLQGGNPAIENDHYIVNLDPKTGYISSVQEKVAGTIHRVKKQFMEYRTQRSGSYIFRSEGAAQSLLDDKVFYIHITRGPLFQQAIIGTARLTMTIRLPLTSKYGDIASDYIQMNYDIHTLPSNTELTTRFGVASDKTGKLLVYDGKDIVRRIVQSDAPLPGHFYPTQAGAIYMYDHAQLVVLTGHTMGVTTWGNELEIMVHRRLAKDDGRGMSQANDDSDTLVVPFFFKLKTKKGFSAKSVSRMHSISHMINQPLNLFVTDSPANYRPEFHALAENLNSNLHILTLSPRDYVSEDIQLRIQNFSPVEDISVDLDNLFKPNYLSISNIRRKSLNLVYDIPSNRKTIHDLRPKFKAGKEISFSFTTNVAGGSKDANQNTEEEGVFLSDEAIANAKKLKEKEERMVQGQRKLLSIEGAQLNTPGAKHAFTVPANGIISFLVQMKLNEDNLLRELEAQNIPIVVDQPKEVRGPQTQIAPKIEPQEPNPVPQQPVQEPQQEQQVPEQQQQQEKQQEPPLILEEQKEVHYGGLPELPKAKSNGSGLTVYIIVLLIIGLIGYIFRARFVRAWHRVKSKRMRTAAVLLPFDADYKSH